MKKNIIKILLLMCLGVNLHAEISVADELHESNSSISEKAENITSTLLTMGVSIKNETDMNIMQESKDTCKSGNATKCFNLAFLYDFGEGVEQDKLKAIELYTQACDLGYAGGCLILGAIYHAGENVKKDLLRAKRLYSRACDEGSERACKEYSILKVNEKLVSK